MSRKRNAPEKSANDKDGAKPGLDRVIIQGIWGLIYTSVGVLALISLLFYSHNQVTDKSNVHILGPYLGTSLALGMIYLFGRIAAFVFPAAVCYIGAAKFMGRPLRLKLLLFLAVLTVELCLLLAVKHMPALSASGLAATANSVGANYMGMFMANALNPLFKGRMLGPYFITAVLMVITLSIGLRIRPQTIAAFVAKWFMALMGWIKKTFLDVKKGIEDSPDIRKEPSPNTPEAAPALVDAKPAEAKKTSRKKDKKTVPITAVLTSADESVSALTEVVVDDSDYTDTETGKVLSFDEEVDKIRGRVEISSAETAEVEPQLEDAVIPPVTDEENEAPAGDSSAESDTDGAADNDDADGDIDYKDGDIMDGAGGGDFKVDVFKKPSKQYVPPSPSVLPDPPPLSEMTDREAIYRNSAILEKTLKSFRITGEVKKVSPGPVVTRYEMEIEAGTKVSSVVNLQNDISLAVGGLPVRIQAPIPGKAAIGIELPNPERQNIYFKDILTSDVFKKSVDTADIPVVIGKNISGGECVADIAKTPHLLIAGTTGSGKSVCMNALICSMLMTRTPEQLRLIMIDPKVVEMANFADIPHLLAPVVTEPKEAVKALQWGVNEMERRYKLLGKSGAKKLETFNERVKNGELTEILDEEENKPLPLIVIIIDELADLMMTASKDVESLIMRITQKARAAGIHLIVATQRPSVDIVTGKIKSNLPSRIGFRTVQAVDSRTILDRVGAEKLLGLGDMLFLRNGATDIERFHGAFISEKEVDAIVDEIRAQGVETEKIGSFHDVIEDEDGGGGEGGMFGDGDRDALFFEAAKMTVQIGQGSTSLLQTRLKIGFARARRIMDEMEQAGIVGPSKGGKVREVLVSMTELADIV